MINCFILHCGNDNFNRKKIFYNNMEIINTYIKFFDNNEKKDADDLLKDGFANSDDNIIFIHSSKFDDDILESIKIDKFPRNTRFYLFSSGSIEYCKTENIKRLEKLKLSDLFNIIDINDIKKIITI